MADEDKATADPLIDYLEGGDRQALPRAGSTQATRSLIRLMDAQESLAPDRDSEKLMRAAWALDKAHHWFVPAVSIAWLQERPGHARLAIVLCLLTGSWSRASEAPPPNPAQVEALLGLYEGLPRDIVNENGLLLVLVGASRAGLPAPLEARIRHILERARDIPDRQPEVKALLDACLDKPTG